MTGWDISRRCCLLRCVVVHGRVEGVRVEKDGFFRWIAVSNIKVPLGSTPPAGGMIRRLSRASQSEPEH